MDNYHSPDRQSRLEIRRTHLDHAVRRSVSLDAQGRGSLTRHHDNYSLGGDSYGDDDFSDGDDNDQRRSGPLPCVEGCRDILTKLMSPLISSVAIDRPMSLKRGEPPNPPTPQSTQEIETSQETSPAKVETPVDAKTTAFAARKSVRELYGRPSWWGDEESDEDEVKKEGEKSISRPVSAQLSRPMSLIDRHSPPHSGQETPRKQAEAFTINIGVANSSAGGSVPGVPERIRRALEERQQIIRKNSVPLERRPTTAPTTKNLSLKRTSAQGPLARPIPKTAQTPSRPKTTPNGGARQPNTSSPKPPALKVAPSTDVSRSTKAPVVQSPTQRRDSPKLATRTMTNPLTQRNRIPLRPAPVKSATAPALSRKPVTTRGDISRPSPRQVGSPPTSRTCDKNRLTGAPAPAVAQSNRVPLKRGSTSNNTAETGSKRPVGSPLQRRVVNTSLRNSGIRQATPTRTVTSEDKKTNQTTTRLTRAPVVSNSRSNIASGGGAAAKSRPTRPLFNSLKKPITTTTTTTTTTATGLGGLPTNGVAQLPTRPIFSGSALVDPLVQEIWSYKEAKDYVMEKMFQGISTYSFSALTTAKTPTQTVFEEFKVAMAASNPVPVSQPSTSKSKTPAVCTPEEKKELELFEKVEAELDKFGEDEEEALNQALSPLVEDFSKTWIRGKHVSNSLDTTQTPIDKLPVVDDSSTDIAAAAAAENPANQVVSTAASTATLENPTIKPEDLPTLSSSENLQTAQSVQSIAETYVLDVNDTLAAEGIPPVVIYDSVEKLQMEARGKTSLMETSQTCTIPYQGTMTSRSLSESGDDDGEETEALQIFEKEVNEEFKGEADSLSGVDAGDGGGDGFGAVEVEQIEEIEEDEENEDEDSDAKSNGINPGSRGDVRSAAFPPVSRQSQPGTLPEYLTKTPCWTEKREVSKKSQGQSGGGGKIENSKKAPLTTATASNQPNQYVGANFPRGRIFTAEEASNYLNASRSPSSSSSSSSSPLIEQFKEEFLQPEIKPQTLSQRPNIQPFETRTPQNQRTHSASTNRSWNTSFEENWSQLRRHASRSSIHSEYASSIRSPRVGQAERSPRIPSIKYCSRSAKRPAESVYRFSGHHFNHRQSNQPTIRSTHSSSSLDTALLLRDSQEALNEIARRIYRQPAHPSVPATPIQLPQLQNLSSYMAQRYTDASSSDKSQLKDQFQPISPVRQPNSVETHSQLQDRSPLSSKLTNQMEPSQPSRHFLPTNPNQSGPEVRQSAPTTVPYSQPTSDPPVSPVSISSATESNFSLRTNRRPPNSHLIGARRHSLRNSNFHRADSPTANDIFPSEHTTTTAAPVNNLLATKVTAESKVTPSRAMGISVTTTVPPLVLQRRTEPEIKHCSSIAITPKVRSNPPDTLALNAGLNSTKIAIAEGDPSPHPTATMTIGGLAKPMARRFDPDEVLSGSAFTAVPRIPLRPADFRSSIGIADRPRRSMSLGPVDDSVGDSPDNERPSLPDPSDKSYETLLAASILRLSNRLRRCSDNLIQRMGAPASETNSPLSSVARKPDFKPSSSLHQELNDSLLNMQTVEQQLQYVESILFGGSGGNTVNTRSKSSDETDYLQELERINNELRGFVPIGSATAESASSARRAVNTAVSLISTEATDSGVDASLGAERVSDVAESLPTETPNGCQIRKSEESAFSNENFY